jgi:hypothetical protein
MLTNFSGQAENAGLCHVSPPDALCEIGSRRIIRIETVNPDNPELYLLHCKNILLYIQLRYD